MTLKAIIIVLLLTSILNANITATQNIRALYKNINLTEIQEDYILDNQDDNVNILQKELKKEVKKLKFKYINEKNIVSFMLDTNGNISKIKFLKKSDNRKLDKATKKAIKRASKIFIRPEEKTILRFIISYKIGQPQKVSNNINQSKSKKNNIPSYQNIQRGTTRFQHSSKEYVRVFETSKDGFVNISVNPQFCMERATILTKAGQQVIIVGMYRMSINKEIAKGEYKILLKTKKLCNVNLQYQ